MSCDDEMKINITQSPNKQGGSATTYDNQKENIPFKLSTTEENISSPFPIDARSC